MQRLTLPLVVLVLIAGALALWLSDGTPPGNVIAPPASAEPAAAPSAPAARRAEPLPPEQEYVLAVSWHAAFCEARPNLRECRQQDGDDYTADHFSLHGLWPQDAEYCGVSDRLVDIDRSNRWSRLPEIEVSNAVWRDLVRLMPGTDAQLERHEWIYHGTCAGVSAETYFRRSIDLTEEINRSAVRNLFADRIGRQVSGQAIRDAFDRAFGAGAGRKVRLDCENDDGRRLAYELRVNLDGDVMGSASLAELIRAGRNISVGCNGGVVDRIGEQ